MPNGIAQNNENEIVFRNSSAAIMLTLMNDMSDRSMDQNKGWFF